LNGGQLWNYKKLLKRDKVYANIKKAKYRKSISMRSSVRPGLAPSGKNIQNWHFVVVQNEGLKQKIGQAVLDKNESICLEMDKIDKARGDAFRKFVKNFTLFFLKAPVITVVFTTEYRPSGYYEYEFINCDPAILYDLVKHKNPGMQSLGAALQNFTLKSIDLGYGTCWITSANYASSEIEALLKEEIGFEKEDYFMGAMIALGIPEDGQMSPNKKPFEQILTYIE
jgi:nitroreductase